jgi:hypothetical protein
VNARLEDALKGVQRAQMLISPVMMSAYEDDAFAVAAPEIAERRHYSIQPLQELCHPLLTHACLYSRAAPKEAQHFAGFGVRKFACAFAREAAPRY